MARLGYVATPRGVHYATSGIKGLGKEYNPTLPLEGFYHFVLFVAKFPIAQHNLQVMALIKQHERRLQFDFLFDNPELDDLLGNDRIGGTIHSLPVSIVVGR